MWKRTAVVVAAAFIVSMGIPSGNALAADKIIMNIATGTAPDHPENVGANKFKEIIEKKSNGRVEVRVHPAGQLGSQRDFVEALRSGTVEITMVTLGFFSAYDPLLNIFELPYLFRDRDHAYRVVDGPIGAQIKERVNKKGVHVMAFWEAGLRFVTNNVRPINKPDDLKGLKIRVPESKISIDGFKTFGANPAPLPFTEVYMALKQGVFDGQENPPSNIYRSKLYESQKYLSLTGHQFLVHMFMYSGQLWDQLPADMKQLVEESAVEAGKFQRDFTFQEDTKLVGALKDAGMQVNQVDKQAFIDKAKPLYAEYAKLYGDDAKKLIEQIQATK
jgi:TRAP-type transport system periplasmic protein